MRSGHRAGKQGNELVACKMKDIIVGETYDGRGEFHNGKRGWVGLRATLGTGKQGKVLYIDNDNDEEEAPRKRRYNMKCDTDDEYDNDVPTCSHTKVVKRHKNEEDILLGVKAMLADIRQKVHNNNNAYSTTIYTFPS
ncbi:hypothetical protein Pelo_19533 [Pelomyxa schiedti]|nr:hypothetical protein Pelo_19533 [Pelomyxa schiedti]